MRVERAEPQARVSQVRHERFDQTSEAQFALSRLPAPSAEMHTGEADLRPPLSDQFTKLRTRVLDAHTTTSSAHLGDDAKAALVVTPIMDLQVGAGSAT